MVQLKVTLPDGSQKEFEKGTSFMAIAESIGRKLAKAALAVKVGEAGQLLDMNRSLDADASIAFVTPDSDDGLEVIRHSTAHVLAMAVQKLWPGTKVTIGPVVKDGFYYDFEFPEGVKLSEKDLAGVEKEMKRIIKRGHKVFREEISREDAIKKFEALGESYKVEIIKELPEGETITLYGMDEWFDLCRGPHVPSVSTLGAFKLTMVAGAYWRGDEKNTMLTRVYGTAWPTRDELEAYLKRIEEAKKRDHRVLGKQLDLFSFHADAPAHAFFHEKGSVLYQRLISFMRKSNAKFGFNEVGTPLMMNVEC